ncbi:hypothetical protein GPNCGGLF_LOCUS1327 [Methylorubrum aminovorans]
MAAETLAGLGEAGGDRAAGLGEALGQLGPARQERLFQALGRAFEGLADGAALAVERLDQAGTGLGQGLRDGAGIVGQRAGQRPAGALEGLRHLVGALLQRAGQVGADLLQAAAHALAGGGELADQVVASRRDVADHPLADFAERRGDRLTAGVERPGDALARTVDRRDDALGRALQLARQVLVRAGDRPAHPVGAADDGFTLGDQLVDEAADADLVVGIGPLQGRDFAAHQGFEFARAGQRPLHAVADGGDLAAHGLRHREHGIRREALRLRQPDRHLADGTGDEAHLVGAHRQHRRDEEQHDRPGDGGGHHRRLKRGEPSDERLQVAAGLVPGERHEAVEPEEGGDRRDEVRLARGPHPKSLLQDTDVLAVVVGYERAVGRQQAALATRAAALRQGKLRGGGIDVEVRGAASPGFGKGIGQQVAVADIGQAGLDAGGLARRRDVQIQSLLDRGEGRLRRILQLFLGGHATLVRIAVQCGARALRNGDGFTRRPTEL